MKRVSWLFNRVGGIGPGWKHRDALVGWFYNILALGDGALAESLHRMGRKKPFAYAARPTETGFWFLLTSFWPEVCSAFEEGLAKKNEFAIAGVTYRAFSRIELDRPRLNRPCVFWAASPVVVSKPEDSGSKLRKVYVDGTAAFDEFSRRIGQNIARKAKELTGADSPVAAVLFPNPKRFLIHYKGGVVAGYSGLIAVDGPAEVLEVAAYAGVGERTGSGFGAVLLREEVCL